MNNKRIVKKISFILLITILVSCNNSPTIQQYIVESKDRDGFQSIDLSTNILKLKSNNVSDEIKEAYKSIKKINLVLKTFDSLKPLDLEKEQKDIESILKNSSYKNLGRVKHEGIKIGIYFTGETDAIDEVILFGYSKEKAIGIARLLGENINPSAVLEMIQNSKLDIEKIDFNMFKGLVSSK